MIRRVLIPRNLLFLWRAVDQTFFVQVVVYHFRQFTCRPFDPTLPSICDRLLDALLDKIFDLMLGPRFRLGHGSGPSRKICLTYTKEIGRAECDKKSASEMDSSFRSGLGGGHGP